MLSRTLCAPFSYGYLVWWKFLDRTTNLSTITAGSSVEALQLAYVCDETVKRIEYQKS